MKLNHKLRWGGTLNGSLIHDVELNAPESGICLKLEGVTGSDAITHRVLSECTESMSLNDALSFWKTVKVPDAEEALLELLKLNWPDDAEEVPIRVISILGEIDNVIINLGSLEKYEDAKPDFTVDLRDGFEVRGETVKQITGEVYNLGQSIEVSKYASKPVEKSFRIIAMTCHDASRPDLVLNLKNVQAISSRDRKRIEHEIEEGHQIVNFDVDSIVNGSIARGRVSLADFL